MGCTAQLHNVSKQSLAETSFYVKENEIRAFIKPVFDFPKSLLWMDALDELLDKSLTLKEWNALFEGCEMGMLPDWLEPFCQGNHDQVLEVPTALVVTLDSHRLIPSGAEGLHSVPALSFDDESIALEDLVERWNAAWIKEFQCRFVSLKNRWGKAFADVEANHFLIVRDLQVLQKAGLDLAGSIGKPFPPLTTPTGSSIWDGLQALFNNVRTQGNTLLSQSELLQRLQLQQEQLQDSAGAEKEIRETTDNALDEHIQHNT